MSWAVSWTLGDQLCYGWLVGKGLCGFSSFFSLSFLLTLLIRFYPSFEFRVPRFMEMNVVLKVNWFSTLQTVKDENKCFEAYQIVDWKPVKPKIGCRTNFSVFMRVIVLCVLFSTIKQIDRVKLFVWFIF